MVVLHLLGGIYKTTMAITLISIIISSTALSTAFKPMLHQQKHVFSETTHMQSEKMAIIETTTSNVSQINEISIKKAFSLRSRLQEIEEKHQGITKIKKQINVLIEAQILPSNLHIDNLLVHLQKWSLLAKSSIQKKQNILAGGPMIVVHFTPGGYINGLAPLGTCLKNFSKQFSGILNGTSIGTTMGIVPLFIGYTFSTAYITAINWKREWWQTMFCPFFELLFPAIGESTRVKIRANTDNPQVLFEFNIDACFLGILGGKSVTPLITGC